MKHGEMGGTRLLSLPCEGSCMMTQRGKMSEIEFFGRITAGFTHELKNVLATVRESAGLMEDILGMSQGGASPHSARLSRSLAIIQGQVKRGIELLSGFNRFAHSPDQPGNARLDLNETVEQIVLLSQRFARLKGVTLKALRAEEAVPVELPLVLLQMVLFSGLEFCWNRTPTGGEVSLCVAGKESGPVVDFLCRADGGVEDDCFQDAVGSESWENLVEMVECLGGAMGIAAGFPGLSVRLSAGCSGT